MMMMMILMMNDVNHANTDKASPRGGRASADVGLAAVGGQGEPLHPVSITRFPLTRFSPGAGLLSNLLFHR